MRGFSTLLLQCTETWSSLLRSVEWTWEKACIRRKGAQHRTRVIYSVVFYPTWWLWQRMRILVRAGELTSKEMGNPNGMVQTKLAFALLRSAVLCVCGFYAKDLWTLATWKLQLALMRSNYGPHKCDSYSKTINHTYDINIFRPLRFDNHRQKVYVFPQGTSLDKTRWWKRFRSCVKQVYLRECSLFIPGVGTEEKWVG